MKRAMIQQVPVPDYTAVESLNTLATNITFTENNTKAIVLTSCRKHDGKSSLSFLVAKTLCEMGYDTVLIDADLRGSVLKSNFGVRLEDPGLGLSHYLSREDVEMDDIIYQTNINNFFLIPSGHDVANSMQLLSSKRLELLIQALKAEFDYIIIDTPPVGAIVDAATVGRCCDGALLVVTYNQTTRGEVRVAQEQIQAGGCPLLGMVLNKVVLNRASSKYYYHSYYYSSYGNYYYKRSDEERKKRKEND